MKRNKPRNFAIGLFAVLTVIGLFADWSASRADRLANRILRGSFEVTIYEGQSASSGPVTLSGILALRVDPSGGLTGALTPAEGETTVVFGSIAVPNPRAVRVAGQINGRAFNMILDLGDDRFIFGVGTAQRDVSRAESTGQIGGPAAGPEPSDRGDWRSTLRPYMEQDNTN